MTKPPNPGSPEAIEAGCICPRMDNHNGAGIPQPDGSAMHWRNTGCPLHNVPSYDALLRAVGAKEGEAK